MIELRSHTLILEVKRTNSPDYPVEKQDVGACFQHFDTLDCYQVVNRKEIHCLEDQCDELSCMGVHS